MIQLNSKQQRTLNVIMQHCEKSIKQKLGFDIKIMYQQQKHNHILIDMQLLDDLLLMICEVIGVDVSVAKQKTRKGEVVLARQMYNYYARRNYPYTHLKDIAKLVNQDHTSVVHSTKLIRDYIAVQDQKILHTMDLIDQRLKMKPHENKPKTKPD